MNSGRVQNRRQAGRVLLTVLATALSTACGGPLKHRVSDYNAKDVAPEKHAEVEAASVEVANAKTAKKESASKHNAAAAKHELAAAEHKLAAAKAHEHEAFWVVTEARLEFTKLKAKGGTGKEYLDQVHDFQKQLYQAEEHWKETKEVSADALKELEELK